MARGIMIFGGAGSGKTTLGRMTAQALGCAFFDLDDYIWRKDTAVPFTVMYTREEKIERLMTDVLKHERFVMAGSMSSFHEAFDSMFDGMIYLKTDTAVRLARLRKRERERYGDRILENGDLVEHHRRFLESASR
ncbi:MAG: AAA family ATPase, partial [Clostridia bacterium]|nr:AAA family ATPase [Clostridia bacterium]